MVDGRACFALTSPNSTESKLTGHCTMVRLCLMKDPRRWRSLLLAKWTFHEGKCEVAIVDDDALSKSILGNKKCYLLDCGSEVFVWVGRITVPFNLRVRPEKTTGVSYYRSTPHAGHGRASASRAKPSEPGENDGFRGCGGVMAKIRLMVVVVIHDGEFLVMRWRTWKTELEEDKGGPRWQRPSKRISNAVGMTGRRNMAIGEERKKKTNN
ncbi:villin-like 1 [Striga asiatica]|uniref:Villin-like 1 n=1 Tax=Striga asiatica TaxID=4170 RepID=A0A5A7PDY4_STRAF|nr:villin-like 1 [Striga asiatica]